MSTKIPFEVPALDFPAGLTSLSPDDKRLSGIPRLPASVDGDDDDSSYDMNLQGYNITTQVQVQAPNSIRSSDYSLHRTCEPIQFPHIEAPVQYAETEWVRTYDEVYNRYYLCNSATGESKWEDQDEQLASASAGEVIIPINEDPWVRVYGEEGQSYWYNNVTHETLPENTDFISSPVLDQASSTAGVEQPANNGGWSEYFDANGNKYFFNDVTGEYSWHAPCESQLNDTAADILSLASSEKSKSPSKSDALGSMSLNDASSVEGDEVLGSLGESSDSAQLNLLHSRFIDANSALAKADATASFNIDENASDEMTRPILQSSFAVQWRWPWTRLYDYNRKRDVFVNDVTKAVQLEPPANMSSDAYSDTRGLFEKELLLRSLSDTDRPIVSPTLFSLCQHSHGHNTHLGPVTKTQIVHGVEGRYRGLIRGISVEELRNAGPAHSAYRVSRLRRTSHMPRKRKAGSRRVMDRVRGLQQQLQQQSLSPASPERKPLLSTPLSKGSIRPNSSSSTIARRPAFSPSFKGMDEALSSKLFEPHRASAIRLVVISIFTFTMRKESKALKELIFNRHISIAIQKQRMVLESFRRQMLDRNECERPQSPSASRRRSHQQPIYASTVQSQSIEEFISLYQSDKAKEPFEHAMSHDEYADYLSVVGEASSSSNIESMLKLVLVLLKASHTSAHSAACEYMTSIHKSLSEYKLTEVEKSFVELLYLDFGIRCDGQYSKKSVILELASRLPDDAVFTALIADMLRRLEYIDEAEMYFIASLVRDPLNCIGLRGHAHLLALKRKDYEGAIKLLSRIGLGVGCDDYAYSAAKLEAAWCSELAGNNESISLQYYSSVLSLSAPKTIASLTHSCIGHLLRRDASKAEGYLTKALVLDPDNAHAHILLSCHRGVHDPSASEGGFKAGAAVLKADKSSSQWMAYLALGDFAALVLRNYELALSSYRHSINFRTSISPLIAFIQLLPIAKTQADEVEANLSWGLTTLKNMNTSRHDSDPVYISVAYTYLELDMIKEAEAMLSRVSSKGLQLSYMHRCYAYVALKSGSIDYAMSHMFSAVSCGASNPFALRSSAALHALNGDYSHALKAISESLSLDSLSPSAWELRAILVYLVQGNDLLRTLECLDLSLKLRHDLDVLRMKGQILFELEKVVDAKMIFEEVLAKRADDSMALVSLLICYKALWLKEKNKVNTEISPRTTRTTPYKSMILATVELLDKQLESENDAMCSEVCFRLGMFYLNFPKKKHYKIAKAILMRAARGLHPLSTFMIGWLLEVEGRLEQAEDFYMKSIALDPMSPIQFHKLSLMAQSTFTYVKGLIKIANQQNTSKVPSKHSMRPSEKNLPVRIMLHERVAYKLQLLMTSRAASIVGPCRVYVDPLWTAKFLYSYAVCENWCSFPKKSS